MSFQIKNYKFGNKEILLSYDQNQSDNHIFTMITGKNGVGKSRLLVSLVSNYLSNHKNTKNLNKVIAVSNIKHDKFPERNEKFNNYHYIGNELRYSVNSNERYYLFKHLFLNSGINHQSLCYSFNYLGFEPIMHINIRPGKSIFIDKSSRAIAFLEIFINYINFLNKDVVPADFLLKFNNTHMEFFNYSNIIDELTEERSVVFESFETTFMKKSKSNRNYFIDEFLNHLKINYTKDELFFIECLSKLSRQKFILDHEKLLKLSTIILRNRILPHLKNVVFELNIISSNLIDDTAFLIDLDLIKISEVKLKPKEKEDFIHFFNLSSGQQSLFNILIGISSVIEDNSLICIDEPEVNLHPEWQNEFIIKLQNIFNHLSGCHFIIATHSPQIVSGLTSGNGFVVDLENNITHTVSEYSKKSADFQLANIFGYPGHNNEYLIRIALTLLSKITKKIDLNELDKDNLNILNNSKKDLPENDPVSFLIEQINALV